MLSSKSDALVVKSSGAKFKEESAGDVPRLACVACNSQHGEMDAIEPQKVTSFPVVNSVQSQHNLNGIVEILLLSDNRKE
jgi:hypothetical protein